MGDPRVTKVVALTRRPLPPHARLENPVVDFDVLDTSAPWWKADAVICTLGTTMAKAGSKDAFRRVDFDYSLAVARLARRNGTTAFAINSSVGADPTSGSFYLRVKGEVEHALMAAGFASLAIVRPSLLLGKRAEFRLGERLAAGLFRLCRPLVPRRYRGVQADRVAAALLEAAITRSPGTRIIESEELI